MGYRILGQEASQEPQEESFLEKSRRHIARNATNLATTVAGMPGDIASTGNQFIANPIRKHILGQDEQQFKDTEAGKIQKT